MAVSPALPRVPEVYTAAEVAHAAGVPASDVRLLLETGQVASTRGFILQDDAIRLVRVLTGRAQAGDLERMPITVVRKSRRNRGGVSFFTSTAVHALFALLLIGASTLGWLRAENTEVTVPREKAVRLVFLNTPGPGGGGGGGGLRMPQPPPKAQIKAPAPQRISSPVPPPRRIAAPPRPVPRRPPPRPVPPPVPTPPAPEAPPALAMPWAVQAPVASLPSDPVELAGLPDPPAPSRQASSGSGGGGGVGSGEGVGLGQGRGGGIGDGSGGGTGGGPYRPGSGIEPPGLIREVRASYTSEARRLGIEGDVVLEIVVGRDGSVSNLKVLRSLGAGLDQKAVEAVRQWRFTPARRQGAPVDVLVTVSVEFSLR